MLPPWAKWFLKILGLVFTFLALLQKASVAARNPSLGWTLAVFGTIVGIVMICIGIILEYERGNGNGLVAVLLALGVLAAILDLGSAFAQDEFLSSISGTLLLLSYLAYLAAEIRSIRKKGRVVPFEMPPPPPM